MDSDMKWRMLAAIPAILFTMEAAAQGPAVSSLAPRVKVAMDQVAAVQEKGITNPQIYAGTTNYVERYEDEVRKFMADAKRQCPN